MTITEQLDNISRITQATYAYLGGPPLSPEHFLAQVKGETNMAPRRFRVAPTGQVTVTCTWDPAFDGGVTDNYVLTILDSSGATVSTNLLPGMANEFAQFMVDSQDTFTAKLTAFSAAGVPCVNPGMQTFVPHISPTVPGDPTGFSVSVGP